jgi:hypothetical protein
MGKVKMFAVAGLAAAVIGASGLAAAPSASAMPQCGLYLSRWQEYGATADSLFRAHKYESALFYAELRDIYFDLWDACTG